MDKPLSASFEYKKFQFKRPSGTSRGVLTEKHAWFISLFYEDKKNVIGLGECSVIPGLSPDFLNHELYEKKLKQVCSNPDKFLSEINLLEEFPSIKFGLETAFLDLKSGGKRLYFHTPFYHGNL